MADYVKLKDARFAPFEKSIREISAFDILDKFEKVGALDNYRRVSAGMTGGHNGFPWFHGLICECITGISDLIGREYNEELDARMDAIIAVIKQAQAADPEGFVNPFTTLMRPKMRFGLNGGSALWQHEIYNTGCLVEAGVHHYRATDKTALLQCAVKAANYYVNHVNHGEKWKVVCEHAVTEMALVELEELLQEEPELAEKVGAKPGEYAMLAKLMVDYKGDHQGRHQFPPYLGEYSQDHRPAREQDEAVGHAVRAALFYAGMASVSRYYGDEGLKTAAEKIWANIAETKLHISGGVGAFRDNERFGYQYELPNDAYLETCAGVALAFFGRELFTLKKDSGIFDVLDMTFTNLIAASVSADFTRYTYENPLVSDGTYERWAWHDCPCCPPMLLKIVGTMPNYIFTMDGSQLFLNMHVDAEAELSGIHFNYENGVLTADNAEPMVIHIRVPQYAKNFTVNGMAIPEGYGYYDALLRPGKALTVRFEEPAAKMTAHPFVTDDEGRVAIMKGAMLYAYEGEAESFEAFDPVLDHSAPVLNSDGTVTVRTVSGEKLPLIEYPSWNNHGKKMMRIWLKQEGLTADPEDLTGWEKKLYQPM